MTVQADSASSQARPWRKFFDDAARAFDDAPKPDSRFEDLVRAAAHSRAHSPFLSTALPNGWSATLSFAQFDEATRRFASFLRKDAGLEDGAVVAVQGPNALSTLVAMVGTLRAGLMLTNVNPLYTPAETKRQLASSGAALLVMSDVFAQGLSDTLEGTQVSHVVGLSIGDGFGPVQRGTLTALMRLVKRASVAINPGAGRRYTSYGATQKQAAASDGDLDAWQAARGDEAPALLQYSGGTTGTPKAAQLTLKGLMVNLAQGAHHSPADAALSEQAILLVLPLYHMFGLYVAALSLSTANHLVLAPSPRPLSNLRKAFERFTPAILPGVNTLFLHLLDEPWFSSVARHIDLTLTGATALDPAVMRRWHDATQSRVIESYGLTEATTILTQNPGDARCRPGTVGIPVPGTRVAIKTEEGAWAKPGQPGEIYAKGPQIMAGYAGDEAPEAFDDGWLRTGDIGMMDADGYLTLLDRKKDMLIVGGFNVFPNEIEAVLNAHPTVSESAVVGISDGSAGERAAAYVVLRDNSVEDEALFQHCRSQLTGYKCPVKITRVDALPKSAVGKILRKDLREKANEE